MFPEEKFPDQSLFLSFQSLKFFEISIPSFRVLGVAGPCKKTFLQKLRESSTVRESNNVIAYLDQFSRPVKKVRHRN